MLLGDEPFDRNPVVSVEVSYRPDLHAWRIFHHLADRAVVSRGEQYAIVDLSNERKAQWRGSLNRNRSLLMIGEVRSGNGSLEYHEWIYDRAKGGRLVMQAVARCDYVGLVSRPVPTQ